MEVPVPTAIPDIENVFSKRFPSFETILGPYAVTQESYATSYDDQGQAHRFLVGFRSEGVV